jgi:hypothetical protein
MCITVNRFQPEFQLLTAISNSTVPNFMKIRSTVLVFLHADRQTDGRTDEQRHRQTDRQAGRQKDRRTETQTDRQAGRQAEG